MKTGTLRKNQEEGWFVKIQDEERSYRISSPQAILGKKDLEEFENKIVVFNISKIHRHISHCKCTTSEEYDKCENFVKSGINDCINFTRVVEMGASIDFKESRKRELFEMENELGITGDLRYHNKPDNTGDPIVGLSTFYQDNEWNDFFTDLLGYELPDKFTEKIRNKYNPPTKK